MYFSPNHAMYFSPNRAMYFSPNRALYFSPNRALYFSPNIIRVIRSSRIRWARHVARIGTGEVRTGPLS
jgi:hypothetical protein